MTWHLFGNILTNYGTAANNRGENEGNITTLQKILWQGEVHTTVSAEAIRWALRYYWQTSGKHQVNRQWSDDKNDNVWQNADFNDEQYIDDDVLGFMRADAAKAEANDDEEESADGKKKKKKSAPKGTATVKRGVNEDDGEISAPDLLRRIEAGDIDPKELWVAGATLETETGEKLEDHKVNAFRGVKSAVEKLKQKISEDLGD